MTGYDHNWLGFLHVLVLGSDVLLSVSFNLQLNNKVDIVFNSRFCCIIVFLDSEILLLPSSLLKYPLLVLDWYFFLIGIHSMQR